VRCDRVAELLPAFADGEDVDASARRHVEQCLRCQADIARYRRLRRTLTGLRLEQLTPPVDLLVELRAGLDGAPGGHPCQQRDRRRAAYLGGLAAATAAGVGGVLVLAARGRRLAG
jgi:anti-sigma factor RsiW